MLILRGPVPLLVKAFAAEVAAFKFHCYNQRKATLLKLATVGRWMTSLMVWNSAPGVTFLEARVKEHIKLLPEKTEKHLKCLD